LLLLPGTSHAEHLAAYGQMDIALDPFPANGGVTTTEALWMGVPVVALLGSSVSSRVSSGILSGLGLKDWIASSEEDYVALAVRHAADRAGLSSLRGQMRAMMRASPVGNPVAYCRAVEAAYRAAWRSHCLGGGVAG
jgi:predicted O-linked N-acetylglucosamine transferase (SPINDLY family)